MEANLDLFVKKANFVHGPGSHQGGKRMSTIPVGQDEPPENQEVEILYMRRQGVVDDVVHTHELHFLSDHNLIIKVTINGHETFKCLLWESLDRVRKAAEKPGWEIEWNPAWQTGMDEFRKMVEF